MSNRLATESSPYLRQHADNPVDWWPWCDEAWATARRENKPVLLSIGYSACHWCHVMAHECFEDPTIAEHMNRLFVNIKVDREERPDVDTVYMTAVQAMTGSGGWPMTVFCTPAAVPFFGGTYFPPFDRRGMRGLPYILDAASTAFHEKAEQVEKTGLQLRAALAPPRLQGEGEPDAEQVVAAVAKLIEVSDSRYGGFGAAAPKFPHPAGIDVLLRRHRAVGDHKALDAALVTLDRMARGGIHDQIAGGFHRYSVDVQWAVPHFEKMLYDNAQLAPVYLHAWQLTGDARWREVARSTLDWALDEMRLAGGGFASATDADSEGEEGTFFVWTPAQLRAALGEEDGALACRLFGVSDAGNFEHGTTVLSLPFPIEQVARAMSLATEQLEERLRDIKQRLRAAREARIHPFRDDKVVASWNALLIGALAEAGFALDEPRYTAAAHAAATHIFDTLMVDGTLMRSHLDGRPSVPGFLEDSAYLASALLTLHAATGEAIWFRRARDLVEDMLARFFDPVGGFYDTAVDSEPLLVRPRTIDDSPIPAGQSAAAGVLLRLAALTGEERWREPALVAITPLAPAVEKSPLGLANLTFALEMATGEMREVAVAGRPEAADTRQLLAVLRSSWDPLRVIAWGEVDGVPLLAQRPTVDGRAAAYVCRGLVCDAPTTDVEQLRSLLR